MSRCARATFFLAMSCATTGATAADLAPAPATYAPTPLSNLWRFKAIAYGWATGLDGSVGVGRLPNANVDLTFADIFNHLNGAFMAAFIARNDTFIFGADLIWNRISSNVDFKVDRGPLED